MTRKMAWIGFSYMAGLLAAFILKTGLPAASAVTAAAAALFISLYKNKKQTAVTAAICCFAAALGILNYTFRDSLIYRRAIESDGHSAEFSGTVISSEYLSGDRTSYTLKGKLNGNITAGVVLITDSISAEAGDRLTFSGKASKFSNTYAYNSEISNKAKGIYLKFYSADSFNIEKAEHSLLRTAEKCRDNILDMIKDYMPENEGALLTSMMLGDKSSMESKAKTALFRSGCGHIMAVSGIHMTVIYSFLCGILTKAVGRKISFVISMAVLFMFCMITGFSASAVRAYIMLFAVGTADFVNREGDTLNSLGIAGLIITGFSPFAITDCGFILSFAGVIGIGAAAPKAKSVIAEYLTDMPTRIPAEIKGVRDVFISSLCTFSVTFPVSVLFFDEVSLISPISNMFLVPLCTAALLLGAAAVFTGGASFIARPLLFVASLLCKVVLHISEILASAPVFILPTGNNTVKLAAAVTAAAAAAALVLYKNTAKVCCTVFVVITLTVVLRYMSLSDSIRIAVLLDSGGQAVVIHNGSSASVIDIDSGSHTADKYLKQCGIYDIDLIFSPYKEGQSFLACSGLYDIGSYVQMSDNYSLFDCGYAVICSDNKNNIEINASDKLFKITEKAVSDEAAFCTVLPRSGKYSVSGSKYIISADGCECSSDGMIYSNCCIEFTADSSVTEGRSLFNGGNN